MKTLNLIGLGNKDGRSFFILEINEIFQKYFNEILEKIKIKDRIYEEQLPLSTRTNEIDHFKNKEFDIDVVYTETRIIILVRANKSELDNFKSLIFAYSKMED
jgi:hypothetical protein